jgi:hypothetical protein
LWLGLTLFGGINFLVFLNVGGDRRDAALILIGMVVLTAGLSLAADLRSFAAGVAGGYVLMTVVSGGTCTFTFGDPLQVEGPLVGMFLYGFAIVALGVAAVVWLVMQRRSGR